MDYSEKIVTRTQAQIVLDKLKEVESNTPMHRFVLNDKTVVFCKNKEKINDYIKLR